jgi:hypothetical protein
MGSVNFKLPKGVDSGQYLKLENFGDFRHGEIGDLVIQIELVEKDGFEKMNNDLIYNLFLYDFLHIINITPNLFFLSYLLYYHPFYQIHQYNTPLFIKKI